ncbi:MAG: hypothetical protein Q8M16_04260 [Pirellulaceae bacterium]|nr:hypothetical protein [Pirellulaceae bacterium]
MSKQTLVQTLVAVLATLVGIGPNFSPITAQEAVDSTSTANTKTEVQNPDTGLIVHEWGTFTTFSGSNGVHLDFRPLRDQELPRFVFDRARQDGFVWLGKARLKTRVRMETPVTYFYTDVERKVSVDVEFPKGMLTEFYPPVRAQEPAFNSDNAFSDMGEPIGGAKLHWGEVTLIPTTLLRPAISDESTARWMGQCAEQRILPNAAGNHYEAARATDSALVHIRLEPSKSAIGNRPSGDYLEKFLFYRGVGKFDIPVTVVSDDSRVFQVSNHGKETLRRAIVFRLHGEQFSYGIVPDIAPGQTVAVSEPKRLVELSTLHEIMQHELVAAGLYEREATAMLNTWSTSWFGEQGTRMFYLVPQEVTDRELPLNIVPQPDQLLRVMVGRVEIMSASEEQRLITVVKTTAAQRKAELEKMVEQGIENPSVPIRVPDELVALGRLAEPALHRLIEIQSDPVVRQEAEGMLWQLAQERGLE